MVTVISRFRVRNGLEEQVRQAFINRPRLVEKAPGYLGLEVSTDSGDPSIFLLITRWTTEEAFRTWHRSDAHHQSHGMMPPGLKLDAAFTSLTIGRVIQDPAGIHTLSAALDTQPAVFSQWLAESDAVFALLLAPTGDIRARNRAGFRVFPPNPANGSGSSIWEYLVCSDAESLRQQLAELGDGYKGSLLLNLTDGQQNPITLEVALLGCAGAVLLLGTQEQRHDSDFQTENLRLANDLSVMMREGARRNRELQQANETIARLARTDALTGLANRRTLSEALPREIARAGRLNEELSLIIADLDRFKSINDEYGHVAGDEVLAHTAAVFGSQSRPYDVAARYGGEEFVLLAPGTSTAEALAIAGRIRENVAALELAGCPRRITISLGVATWMPGETPEEWIARADAALYIAKRSGRNRVEAAPDTKVCI